MVRKRMRGGDIADLIGKYIGPVHLPGHNYTGPGTDLDKNLRNNVQPTDRVDAGSKKHDLAYREIKNKYETETLEAKEIIKNSRRIRKAHIKKADEQIVKDWDEIENPTFKETIARAIAKPIIKAKIFLGLGIDVKPATEDEKLKSIYHNAKTGYTGAAELSRKSGVSLKKAREFLKSVDVYTKYRQVNKKFPTRRFYTPGIDKIWQADLVFMPKAYKNKNDGFLYILLCIDTFSKFAWGVPLKTKGGMEVRNAFETIFKEGRLPTAIHTDAGLEFISDQTQALFKKHQIKWYTTDNENKAMIVERLALTLQKRMYRYLNDKTTGVSSKKWFGILPDIIENYNNSFHSSVKMTPLEASLQINKKTVYHNLYGENSRLNRQQAYLKNEKPAFKIGDTVRIAKYGTILDRGYHANFLEEIYTIAEVLPTKPFTYKLFDYNNKLLKGTWYKQELVSAKHDDTYEIKNILDYDDKAEMAFVSWKGYNQTHNSWISWTKDEFEKSKEAGLYQPQTVIKKRGRKALVTKPGYVKTKRHAALGK